LTKALSPHNDAYLDDILRAAYILVEDLAKGTWKIRGRGKKDKYGPNQIIAKAYVPYIGQDLRYYALAMTKTKNKSDPLPRKIFVTEKNNFNSCNYNGELIPEKTCSEIQPYYCDRGRFIPKATVCGCPEGYLPQGDECVFDEIGQYEVLPLIINGSKSRKLDVLFLADKYEGNEAKFEDDVNIAIDTLFGGEIPAYADNYSKFNIYMMADNPNLNCQPSGTRGLTCDIPLVQRFLNYHNIDKAIVLVNDFENRGSAFDPIVGVASSLSKYAPAHEFTHLLNIRDEYGYLGQYTGPPPDPNYSRNCSPSLESCENLEFEFPGQVQCWAGCVYSNWYRMVPNSLMGCSSDGEIREECRTLSPISDKLVREELNKYE